MNPHDPAIDRRLELVLDRALQGLDPAEAAELARTPARPDDLSVELAAAAALLAGLPDAGELPDLPAGIAARVEHQATRFLAVAAQRRPPATLAGRVGRVAPWLGWLAAAAAIILLVRDRNIVPPPAAVVDPTILVPDAPPRPMPAVRLVASAHPLARGAGGSLAWDGARQEGELRIAGLAPVDPGSGCYQLWIFDRSRDDRYPIDGGIFTVPRAAPGQAEDRVVAIRPRLPVRAASLFAITLEPPGGVVVSDRERILLTAPWGAASPAPAPAPPRQSRATRR